MAYLRIGWAALCVSSQGLWSHLWMVIREQWLCLLKWMEQSNLLTAKVAQRQMSTLDRCPSQSFRSEVFWWKMSQYFRCTLLSFGIPAENHNILRFHIHLDTHAQRSSQVKIRAAGYLSFPVGCNVKDTRFVYDFCHKCGFLWSNFLQEKMFSEHCPNELSIPHASKASDLWNNTQSLTAFGQLYFIISARRSCCHFLKGVIFPPTLCERHWLELWAAIRGLIWVKWKWDQNNCQNNIPSDRYIIVFVFHTYRDLL